MRRLAYTALAIAVLASPARALAEDVPASVEAHASTTDLREVVYVTLPDLDLDCATVTRTSAHTLEVDLSQC